jgi:hypothetical protein
MRILDALLARIFNMWIEQGIAAQSCGSGSSLLVAAPKIEKKRIRQ